METWKPIKGYEGLYEVSDFGRVRSTDAIIKASPRCGGYRHRPGIVLKQNRKRSGYLTVCLCKNGIYKEVLVHRLVAEAYCTGNGDQINHINLNKTDNRSENLEWCTAKENIAHMRRNRKPVSPLRKRILCVDTGMEFPSSYQAAEWVNQNRKNFSGSVPGMARNIRRCCSGKAHEAFGFRWKDVNKESSTTIPKGSTLKRVEMDDSCKKDEDIV